MFDVDIAQGEQLDRIAELYGFARHIGWHNTETDEEFRERILAGIRGNYSKQIGPQYFNRVHTGIPEVKIELDLDNLKVAKCECGGHIAKTGHSDWCPIYERF